jgi:hypothetical protein
MSIRSMLFPAQGRTFRFERAVNVALRTLHLVGVAGLGAGFLYPAADEGWLLYFYLTQVTGVCMVLVALYRNAIWLIQLRGQAVLFKLLLLALIPLFPDLKALLLILVVLISGWISHAPGRVRYYSIYHRRQLDSL